MLRLQFLLQSFNVSVQNRRYKTTRQMPNCTDLLKCKPRAMCLNSVYLRLFEWLCTKELPAASEKDIRMERVDHESNIIVHKMSWNALKTFAIIAKLMVKVK